MPTEVYILIGLISAIMLFVLIIAIRTLAFKPTKNHTEYSGEEIFDFDHAVNAFSQTIKCKTVSRSNKDDEACDEFDKLKSLLPELYPNVYRECTLTEFDGRGMLFKWAGESHDSPSVLMAHYDVVPAEGRDWGYDPFSGEINDGYLIGRGTLDTKATFSGILFAADHLINEGFIPKNDIYFAFSGSEEIAGNGAQNIVAYFEKSGIAPAMVLDEGGAVVKNAFPGLKSPCAYIGIAEKGMMDVEYRVRSNGGHASAPKPSTPVGILARACTRIEKHPFKCHITAPVSQMFDNLGRHTSILYRVIFANMWCFGWILDLLGKKQGGDMNAILRTTVAFTQMSGSDASNVIPPEATMVSNLRLNPNDTVDSALSYLRKTVANENVELKVLRGYDPSRISDTTAEGYGRVVNAINATWNGALTTPYLMVQCTDSRHFGRISDKVYRFSAMDLTNDERSTIHGKNERIRLDAYQRTCEFFIRIMRMS